jgi:hypothetical protein
VISEIQEDNTRRENEAKTSKDEEIELIERTFKYATSTSPLSYSPLSSLHVMIWVNCRHAREQPVHPTKGLAEQPTEILYLLPHDETHDSDLQYTRILFDSDPTGTHFVLHCHSFSFTCYDIVIEGKETKSADTAATPRASAAHASILR